MTPESKEREPQPRLEERILRELGYPDEVRTRVIGTDASGQSVTGGKFLDMYRDSEHRQETEDMLEGFLDTPIAERDAEDEAYIRSYLDAGLRAGGNKA